MVRNEFTFPSADGKTAIHAVEWRPDGPVATVLQIAHGVSEFILRYEPFAEWLTERGFAVVGHDHLGHGDSVAPGAPRLYFGPAGSWNAVVKDIHTLRMLAGEMFPGVPYFLLGHSMGSFMARTILCKYPQSGIAGAIISGTGWQPTFAMPMLVKLMELICKKGDETHPNEKLQQMIFGGYNSKIKNARTGSDWLTRDEKTVDAYVAHPLCGFTPSSGLFRDMMVGIRYIQQPKNLDAMKKDLPVFFVSGDKDPVGSYGKGVEQACAAFKKHGMQDVTIRLYPEGRHEMLNELNKDEVYEDLLNWILEKV